LPVAGDYAERNVARQVADPASMLSLYRALARLRRAEPALHTGEYRSLDVGVEDVFAYLRAAPGVDRFLVVLNFGTKSHTLDLGRVARTATVAVATDMRRQGRVDLGSLVVGPNEGLVLRLE
jgi:alpha-glucosidase